MNANEFRLGNLVYYHIEDSMDERKEWDEVSPIDYDDLRCFVQYEDNSEYKPIPLTEEWLLKLGFVKTVFDSYFGTKKWIKGDNIITVINDECFVSMENTFNKQCEYVHQLQNLYFVLTGEELKTK